MLGRPDRDGGLYVFVALGTLGLRDTVGPVAGSALLMLGGRLRRDFLRILSVTIRARLGAHLGFTVGAPMTGAALGVLRRLRMLDVRKLMTPHA